MSKKNISQEKIIQAFLASAFDKSAGATSLSDICETLGIKKASLYNHFESRDSMYDAAIEFCGEEVKSVCFKTDTIIDSILKNKTTIIPLFKRLITRYYNLYETEPLFQIYAFIHTEKYFNVKALKIVQSEDEQINKDIAQIIQAFSATGQIKKISEKEIDEISSIISAYILHNRDIYISNRKEVVRQNPESGVGTLFALPTDDVSLNKVVKGCEQILKAYLDL